MKKILFLDDNNDRTEAFLKNYPDADTVETAEAAIKALQKSKYTDVFLDHDLGGEAWVDSSRDDTGMGVVRWIIANGPAIENIVVHSHNTIAGPKMKDALKDAGYKVVYTPFANLIKSYRGI